MREIRLHGSEGGGAETNRSFLPLSSPPFRNVRPGLDRPGGGSIVPSVNAPGGGGEGRRSPGEAAGVSRGGAGSSGADG